jgi:hypothetical protein
VAFAGLAWLLICLTRIRNNVRDVRVGKNALFRYF